MSYYLFLDDYREPGQVNWVNLPRNVDWYIVRSYSEFVAHITNYGLPKFISFDHDLEDAHYHGGILNRHPDDEERTGNSCAKWLYVYMSENNMYNEALVPEFIVHSMNPVGKQNIINSMESLKRRLKLDRLGGDGYES